MWILVGLAINTIFVPHLIWRKGVTPAGKLPALIVLLIPFLGALFYFILWIWNPPSPQPYDLRNKSEHVKALRDRDLGGDAHDHLVDTSEQEKEYRQ